MSKNRLFCTALVLCMGLAACGKEETTTNEEEVTEPAPVEEAAEPASEDTATEETIPEDVEPDPDNWARRIHEISSNEDEATDKFYELEEILLEFEPSAEEVEQFKSDIIEDYKSGTYLDELDNHDRMLTNIFKSHFVEKNSEGAVKAFAFDYYQNLKYAYRGIDAPDSEAVKSNEEQMNEVLPEIE